VKINEGQDTDFTNELEGNKIKKENEDDIISYEEQIQQAIKLSLQSRPEEGGEININLFVRI